MRIDELARHTVVNIISVSVRVQVDVVESSFN